MTRNAENGGKGWGGRKVAIGLNTAVALALAVTLLGMANYLSYRHYYRADWSRTGYYRLSDKTLTLLASLTGEVDVVVFFQPQQEIYEDVDNLLKEYEFASEQIAVERVDPDRDVARTEELARKFEVTQPNVVVFSSGGRSKYVTANEIMQYDYSGLMLGQPPEKSGFKGEQAFSSAIQSVTRAKRPVVYFLKGHGERDIASFSRTAGYSGIAEEVRRDNIEIKELVLGEQQAIPPDCDALVIAGPDKLLSEAELNLLRGYLEQKGRLLVLLDASTRVGLDPLLAEWGVRLADDVVVDATRTLTGRELFITKYGQHPITRKLNNLTSILYLPRSVESIYGPDEAGGPADRPHVVALASCSDSGWAETDLTESPMKYDPGADSPGPIPIAAAVEKGPMPGIDVQIRPTRLVVLGDSDFVSNSAMAGGNADFFLSSLNWLLEREELIGIAPKPVDQNRLIMTQRELKILFWAVAVILPGFIALFGGLVWLRRRS
ncbi:MAG: GldG family protein [Verrucomicrobiota bacterium]